MLVLLSWYVVAIPADRAVPRFVEACRRDDIVVSTGESLFWEAHLNKLVRNE